MIAWSIRWLGPTRYRLRRRVIEAMRFAKGECIACGARWAGGKRCDECKAKAARNAAKWRRKNPEKATAWYRADTKANPEKYAAKEREAYEAKKVSGTCVKCSTEALPDSNYCERHRELARHYSRRHERMKRLATLGPARCGTPGCKRKDCRT